jgi:hypothetical protein
LSTHPYQNRHATDDAKENACYVNICRQFIAIIIPIIIITGTVIKCTDCDRKIPAGVDRLCQPKETRDTRQYVVHTSQDTRLGQQTITASDIDGK